MVARAEGDVLIAGLGLGMVLTGILDKSEVNTVTVIEKSRDVIDLVEPHIEHIKLNIICADIFDWVPPKGHKWDVIYFDIWQNASIDLEQSTKLKRKFARRKQGIKWMKSWNEEATRSWNRRGL